MIVGVASAEYRISVDDHTISVSGPQRHYTIEVDQAGVVGVVDVKRARVDLTRLPEKSTIVVTDREVRVVAVAEQGPAGPPGPASAAGADLDRMTHPDYPDTRRRLVFSGGLITGMDVIAGDTEVFRREIVMTDGRVTAVTTDDLIGNGRLVKTILYGDDGTITTIDRAVTTWR